MGYLLLVSETQSAEPALIAARLEVTNLQIALEHRTTISAAVGILMERYQLGYDAGFARLARESSTTNVKIYDLARQLVTTGQMTSEDNEALDA